MWRCGNVLKFPRLHIFYRLTNGEIAGHLFVHLHIYTSAHFHIRYAVIASFRKVFNG
jgi:hypothetical protein